MQINVNNTSVYATFGFRLSIINDYPINPWENMRLANMTDRITQLTNFHQLLRLLKKRIFIIVDGFYQIIQRSIPFENGR